MHLDLLSIPQSGGKVVIGMIDDMDDGGTRALITPILHVKKLSRRSKAELSDVLCIQVLPWHFRLPHHCLLDTLKLNTQTKT